MLAFKAIENCSIMKANSNNKNSQKKQSFDVDETLPHCRLARLRCFFECMRALNDNKELPIPLCFIPQVEIFHCIPRQNVPVKIYDSPSKEGKKVKELRIPAGTVPLNSVNPLTVHASGEEYCNKYGRWLKIKLIETGSSTVSYSQWAWVLLHAIDCCEEVAPLFKCGQLPPDDSVTINKLACCNMKNRYSWEDVIERRYALKFMRSDDVGSFDVDVDATARLRQLCPNWTSECDAELARFMATLSGPAEKYGSLKSLVDDIQVSSGDNGAERLTDDNPNTYWESNGTVSGHWIRLHMKKGTVIRKMALVLDGDDGNYIPYHIVIMVGEVDRLKKIQDMRIDLSFSDVQSICILEDMSAHYPVLEIHFNECKDFGIDVRVHGIRIKSSKERDVNLHIDVFTAPSLVRFPLLEGFSKEDLYRRGLVLQRLVRLLDSVLPYIAPRWAYSTGSFCQLEQILHLLPLSKKRQSLIDTLLTETETPSPNQMPKVVINRRVAAEHKYNTSHDVDSKNTVFVQIYQGLKRKDRCEKGLDYRWSKRYDQWWECKFLAEGMIDQGGGFRESMSEISEELCPSSSELPVPLPLFIRAPNQSQDDSNVNRDVYVPNPSCHDYAKYHWLGQLMGACFRSKECLVLTLPPFTWKQLLAESVTWSRDYAGVDAYEVKLIESIEACDEDTYVAHFGDWLSWTATRSDTTAVPLHHTDNSQLVSYANRMEYCAKVKEMRMTESHDQVTAMRRGLLEVVPDAVLQLVTWQELEGRVCGDPDITVEALKKSTRCEEPEEMVKRMKFLWEALTNFSNEDRSRFLRFVTGRRRLPAHIFVSPDKQLGTDALPQSSTCSCMLFLPEYSSAKITEEKLRYAVYNCVAIDTDTNPWYEGTD